MKTHTSFKIQHKCLDCGLRSEGFFCNLTQSNMQTFQFLKITNAYPKGAKIFMEGQPSNGVYMLCRGRVKLSTCSRDGKVIILHIAEAGEVLGLSAAVSDSNYEATAEVIESCQVNFIGKSDFLRFLQQNPEACFSAIKQLSNNYHTAYTQIRSFGLSNTAADKMAKLLLEWCKTNSCENNSIHLKMSYTHEDIAEMIGASRETVTRLLKDFRNRKLIAGKGSDLIVTDRAKLEASIGMRERAKM